LPLDDALALLQTMHDHGAVVDRHSDSVRLGEAEYIAALRKSSDKYFSCATAP
jgi:hypothetical protein